MPLQALWLLWVGVRPAARLYCPHQVRHRRYMAKTQKSPG